MRNYTAIFRKSSVVMHILFLLAIVFNYILPLFVYRFEGLTFLLLGLFILSYFVFYRRVIILKLPYYFGSNERNIILYFLLFISCLFPRNYYFIRLFPVLAIMLSDRGGIINSFLALLALYFTLNGYSKVYFALVPFIFFRLVPGNKLIKSSFLFFGLLAFGSRIIEKLSQFSLTRLFQGELLGFDVLWLSDYIFSNYPSKFSFLYGKSIWAVLTNPIPRSIWNDKPIAYGIELAMNFWGISDYTDVPTNYGPGIVGEAYANFGIVGIIIFAFLVAYMLRLTVVLVERSGFPILFFAPFIFLLIRGDFLNASVNLILQLVVLRLLYKQSYE